MHFEFTQAREEHLNELVELINSAYRGESSKKGWTTEADLLDGQRTDKETLKQSIEHEDSVLLIAQDDETDKIHGCVYLKKEGPSCYLGLLTVNPQIQGQGLGLLLLEESEAFAGFWDSQKIQMTVLAQRPELIAWYKKHGFKVTPETRPFPYGDERFGIPKLKDLHFIVLEKHI